MNTILADNRWAGDHGIGRFSREIISRLQNTDVLNQGPSPTGINNIVWLPYQLAKFRKKYKVFFSPGYMPPFYSSIPFIFTIHDLIHLNGPDRHISKKIFYERLIKPAVYKAQKILTVSEYSKKEIISWANITEDKVIVIKNGISSLFSPEGIKHQPGYPYFFYVGNNKSHKNVLRLLQAFHHAKLDSSIKLILTCHVNQELNEYIGKNHLATRIIFVNALTEKQLAEYYRGAIALLFPSLYEGFGLPVVEAMASGTPVITSNVTSLPEVAGEAALFINPLDLESLIFSIEQISENSSLRESLMIKGLKQASTFSWEQSASQVQHILNQVEELP